MITLKEKEVETNRYNKTIFCRIFNNIEIGFKP